MVHAWVIHLNLFMLFDIKGGGGGSLLNSSTLGFQCYQLKNGFAEEYTRDKRHGNLSENPPKP